MTHFEHIKELSRRAETLGVISVAAIINKTIKRCEECPCLGNCSGVDCNASLINWLNSEVEDEKQ